VALGTDNSPVFLVIVAALFIEHSTAKNDALFVLAKNIHSISLNSGKNNFEK
jgi:hypothetical protein